MKYRKKVLSPAKVNFILRIGPKRKDSYHEIASLMAKLNWGDEMILEVSQDSTTQIDLLCSDPSLENEKNLAYRAAKKFSEAIPVFFRMKISLQKKIPMEGGLGGGSSNAASVLRFLAGWYLKEIGRFPGMEKLIHKLAAELGSDVAFFLAKKNSAWCTGRGEKLEERTIARLPLVLVFPEAKISTAWAYQQLSKKRKKPLVFDRKAPSWLERKDLEIPALENDFEVLALDAHEELGRLKLDLAKSGAAAGHMTGSGSCFFGVYASDTDAEKASHWLTHRGWQTQKVSVGE